MQRPSLKWGWVRGGNHGENGDGRFLLQLHCLWGHSALVCVSMWKYVHATLHLISFSCVCKHPARWRTLSCSNRITPGLFWTQRTQVMYMFYVLIITHLYSNIFQASDIFVQNLFVDNYSYLQTTLSTTVSANPDSISILYAFSGASLDFHLVSHCVIDVHHV